MNILDTKKGQLLRPIEGKKYSNYCNIGTLDTVRFEHVGNSSSSYYMYLITVTIIKGDSYNRESYDTSYEGESIMVNPNAFEPIEADGSTNCEVWW
jgi:hypothetical protein